MGSISTLVEIVGKINLLDENATIYASKPWHPNSTAISTLEPESGELPDDAKNLGLSYFLEVFIARDFLEEWEKSHKDKPSLEQMCLRLIHYAINDA